MYVLHEIDGDVGISPWTTRPPLARVVNIFTDQAAAGQARAAWSSFRSDVRYCLHQAHKVDLSTETLLPYLTPPDGFDTAEVPRLQIALFTAWRALSDADPDAFVRMGRPKVWAYYCGRAAHPPASKDWVVWNDAELLGLPHIEPPDVSRGKSVYDPKTGERWSSVQEAAGVLGINKVSLYAYLRGDPAYRAVTKGRTILYAPLAAHEGSIDAMTEEAREALREKMRAAGVTPKF